MSVLATPPPALLIVDARAWREIDVSRLVLVLLRARNAQCLGEEGDGRFLCRRACMRARVRVHIYLRTWTISSPIATDGPISCTVFPIEAPIGAPMPPKPDAPPAALTSERSTRAKARAKRRPASVFAVSCMATAVDKER